jgi:aspartate-semialdehyde dehydrogenase
MTDLPRMTEKQPPLVLALVGATGTVGRTVLEVLDELDVPVRSLRPFASARSAGTTVAFRDDDLRVEALSDGCFKGCDVAIFCAGAAVAREWAPRAWADGCPAVDDSPAFRGEGDVPLVVPEVNGAELAGFRARGIVASPSSIATALALALAPLRDAAGLARVVVSTYHSASGLGQGGVEELERQARDLLNMREPDPSVRFPHRLAFNVVPQVGAFAEGGATEDELKVVRETRKVLGDDALALSATAVRVPVFFGHSAAVNVATRRPLGAAGARVALAKAAGVKVVDDPAQRVYPMPMLVGNEDAVLVGRLRDDPSQPHGLDLFLSIENTRKGAATNAVQLAQLVAATRVR